MELSGIGAFASGYGTQALKDSIMEPLWGANEKSSDGATRAGQIGADITAIAGGGALAVHNVRKFSALAKAQPDGGLISVAGPAFNAVGKKSGAIAAALLGVGILAAGVANLGWAKGATPPTPPGPTPPGPTPPGPPNPPTPPGPTPPGPNPPGPTPPGPTPPGPTPPGPTPPGPTPPGPTPPGPTPVPPKPSPVDPGQGPAPVPGDGAHEWPVYTVKPGEFLDFIAECNDTTWRALYWHNRDVIGANPDQLRVGMQLKVPPPGTQVPDFAYSPSFDPNGSVPDLECEPVVPVCD